MVPLPSRQDHHLQDLSARSGEREGLGGSGKGQPVGHEALCPDHSPLSTASARRVSAGPAE